LSQHRQIPIEIESTVTLIESSPGSDCNSLKDQSLSPVPTISPALFLMAAKESGLAFVFPFIEF
jgi:hypothetical protein